jgi:hypothetical protein
MFYSIRQRNPTRYGLGYAQSHDGLSWERRDAEMGLDVTKGAWDGEAISYAIDIEAGGKTWLLYNGNDFGGTGFGIAERLQP